MLKIFIDQDSSKFTGGLDKGEDWTASNTVIDKAILDSSVKNDDLAHLIKVNFRLSKINKIFILIHSDLLLKFSIFHLQ